MAFLLERQFPAALPIAHRNQLAQPVAHKVWLLSCKSCGNFLTNRGMKAVLLLRPNVSLFSSDILPLNCSPYNASADSPLPSPTPKPSPSRTCECLTQSLCCHSCGTPIGYMIVVPCIRCTSSISATNRATNGHRFVFHSTEVIGSERHYIEDEPGVIPYDPPLLSPQPPNIHRNNLPSLVSRSHYLPSPPLELQHPFLDLSSPHSPDFGFPPPFYPPSRNSNSPVSSVDVLRTNNLISPPADPKEPRLLPPSLKPGDVIFWHHLSRDGDIPRVTYDERATTSKFRQIFFDR